jgi:hypothetical protein
MSIVTTAPAPTPPPPPSLNDLKLRMARLMRHNRPQAEVDAARQEYTAARLAEFVKATVATAPPLSEDQIATLTTLLKGGEAR